jgi:hypothetical protein
MPADAAHASMKRRRPSSSPCSDLYGKTGVFLLFAFIAILVGSLFYAYQPVPWNGDDWWYLAKGNEIYPSPEKWNPARILPGLIMPLCGYTAAYLIYPFTPLDYVQSLIFVSGLAGAVSFMVAACAAYALFRSVTGSRIFSCFLLIMFLCPLFIGADNTMPAGVPASGPCTIFYYYIPNMLNTAMFLFLCKLHLKSYRIIDNSTPMYHNINKLFNNNKYFLFCFLSIIYFILFSMTTASIIPTAYAGGCIFIDIFLSCKLYKNIKFGIENFIKNLSFVQLLFIFVLLLWSIAAIYDYNGDRYNSLHNEDSIIPVTEAVNLFFAGLQHAFSIHIFILLGITFVIYLSIILYKLFIKKYLDKNDRIFLYFISSSFLSCIVIIALNILILASTGKNLGNNAMFGLLIYINLMLCAFAIYICIRIPSIFFLLPILSIHILSLLWITDPWVERPYKEAEYQKSIINQWIKDIERADKNNLTQAIIYTPTLKWPHDEMNMGNFLSYTLYKHGIISRKIKILTTDNINKI